MFKGILKPYQPEAVAKMVERKKMLVADEMGLGKTCMTIAAIEELRDSGQLQEPYSLGSYLALSISGKMKSRSFPIKRLWSLTVIR
jgi:SNF2 family DNA or RNA helicase